MDEYLRQKNLSLLRVAMEQSTAQVDGFLPALVVVQLSLAYSTVYYLGLDQGGIRGAINHARSQDIKMGLVNINRFLQALVDQFDTD